MPVELKCIQSGEEGLFNHIANDVFDEPVDQERVKNYLSQPGHLMVVAVNDDEIIGQCAAIIHRHTDKVTELYIDEVGVSSDFRRRGIARKMLDNML